MTNLLTERVRQILDATGMTHAAFAERIGIDGSKLSKSLGGQRNFSSSELAAIAQLGRQSVDWLITGAPSRSWQIAARAEPASLSELQESSKALISAVAERFDALEALGLQSNAPALPAPGGAPRLGLQAEELAMQALQLLGESISLKPTPDVIDLVEKKLGINVVVANLPRGCDGVSYQDGPFRLVILGTTQQFARQRFTLGHEIGHILRGDATEIIEEYAVNSTGSSMDEKSERRANAFASIFLACEEDIRNFLDGRVAEDHFDELCWTFRLTPDAMSRRLLALGMIDAATRDTLGARTMRSVGMGLGRGASLLTRTGRSASPRAPMHLVQRCIDAYLAGETTLQAAADLMCQPVEQVREALEDDTGDSPSNSGRY
ncbi:helix-turn-helix domain-containing protein [Rathayibacter sp. Leaf248]|uniref:helix-turn-helix domain-containing protein n=1 Tax=Rathayibacter sp. Leaf248 TaxID=2876555 RepID=UPI001E4D9BAA|nr:XRE family transcriptional regulator [Rathayibacter sp. Leaf248]